MSLSPAWKTARAIGTAASEISQRLTEISFGAAFFSELQGIAQALPAGQAFLPCQFLALQPLQATHAGEIACMGIGRAIVQLA